MSLKNLSRKRFQLQLLFALIAAISVAALAIELGANAVRHAQGFVLADASRALSHALNELEHEYRLRTHDGGSWSQLPFSAQDLTLRGISDTVLASYPGIEGGYWVNSQFAGYSYPTHDGASLKIDVPQAEKAEIERAITRAEKDGKSEHVIRGRHDIIVISALAIDPDTSAWAMKRLNGQAEPVQKTESILLAALVAAALLGAAGVLATGIGLHRGIAQITKGLATLNRDFYPGLPARRDELGEISAAINELARTRGRLEAEIRREDRARTMGRLVGRIAHEMRNPLNSMRLSLQMLAQRHERNRLRSEDFEMVLHEVDRMNRLLSDLLAFQQPRPPKLESVEIGPALKRCTEMVQPQATGSGVQLDIAGELNERALLDEQYLEQIMLNLMLNAVDVSPPGKRVSVQAKADDGRLRIEVCDEGPGLSPEQQEHVFEPFYTTKINGHGLGLALSRELAQAMGGKLWWRSEPGEGATFVLELNRKNG